MLHQCVVPLTFDMDISFGVLYKCHDEVVIQISIQTRLMKSVHRCGWATRNNIPRFKTFIGLVVELSVWPDPVTMSADQVQPGWIVSLGLFPR